MTRPAPRPFAALLAVLLVGSAAPAQAQDDGAREVRTGGPRAYAALGVLPGLGGAVTASVPALGVLTREASLYADARPRLLGGSGTLVVAVAVGGSVQLTRALRVVQNRPPGRFDVDLGARVGPAFASNPFRPSEARRARAFEVMLDPFVRVTTRTGGGRVAFAEWGRQGPSVRAGLAVGLGR